MTKRERSTKLLAMLSFPEALTLSCLFCLSVFKLFLHGWTGFAGGAHIGGQADIVCLELHYKFTGGAYIVVYVCDKRRRFATAAAGIQRMWSIANRDRSSR